MHPALKFLRFRSCHSQIHFSHVICSNVTNTIISHLNFATALHFTHSTCSQFYALFVFRRTFHATYVLINLLHLKHFCGFIYIPMAEQRSGTNAFWSSSFVFCVPSVVTEKFCNGAAERSFCTKIRRSSYFDQLIFRSTVLLWAL